MEIELDVWYSKYLSGFHNANVELCKCIKHKDIILGSVVNAPTPLFCLSCERFINPINLFDEDMIYELAQWFELHKALENLYLQDSIKTYQKYAMDELKANNSEYMHYSIETLRSLRKTKNVVLWKVLKTKNRRCSFCGQSGRLVKGNGTIYHICDEHLIAY